MFSFRTQFQRQFITKINRRENIRKRSETIHVSLARHDTTRAAGWHKDRRNDLLELSNRESEFSISKGRRRRRRRRRRGRGRCPTKRIRRSASDLGYQRGCVASGGWSGGEGTYASRRGIEGVDYKFCTRDTVQNVCTLQRFLSEDPIRFTRYTVQIGQLDRVRKEGWQRERRWRRVWSSAVREGKERGEREREQRE